ncbi:MAG: sigma-54-dependent Fis family transcriptional regulator [Archangium sp.]|nr:sigma-54-dependent Fis family transcriptional regulator [Archangium sp.]
MGNELDQSTIRPQKRNEGSAPDARVWLTIAWHPDVARVGQSIEVLAASELKLSRLEPLFGAEPLGSPFLSRQPVSLKLKSGGVDVAASPRASALRVDGQDVSGHLSLSAERVRRGVVLTLSERVVLVLHRRDVAPAADSLGLVGASEAIERLRALTARVAASRGCVLLRGESGTGKELIARALGRPGAPFVAVNVAAIPESTAAAELFGHAKGAFTGAETARDGLFVSADGGTLFLDEIGELSLDLQAALLRVLETGEVQPLGKPARKVDVRVIAATDADLDGKLEARTFREALFHRLATHVIQLPPLRERREDIGRLFVHFLRDEVKSAARLEDLKGEKPWLPASVLERSVLHAWPGNVRALRNAVRRLCSMSDGPLTDAEVSQVLGAGPLSSAAEPAPPTEKSTIDDDALLEALRANAWKPTPTARQLGISRTTLYALIDASTRLRKAKDVSREELESALKKHGGVLSLVAAQFEVSERGLALRCRELGLDSSVDDS